MKVTSAQMIDREGNYSVTFDDGHSVIMDTDGDGERDRALAAWFMAGNKADPYVETIEARRASSFLSRGDFCRALMRAEILPPAEAAKASIGEWPESFTTAIASLPPMEQAEAMIEWSEAKTVNRLHPRVLSLAKYAGIQDEALDELFGITHELP